MEENSVRLIILKDQYGAIYVATNASKEEIQKAIDYKNDLLVNDQNNDNLSAFELIQNYLEEKELMFVQVNNLETYYW